jgi:hypothetical protein
MYNIYKYIINTIYIIMKAASKCNPVGGGKDALIGMIAFSSQ